MLVIVLRNLMRFFTKKSFYHQGFFAVKRRAVFILGAKWKALVRGWRRDCVFGGMELVSNDAKRTVAPPNAKHSTLLQGCFLCFCFLVPFTIRQQCRIYPQEFFHRTVVCYRFYQYLLFIQSLADAFLDCGKFVLLQPKKGDIL